MIFFFKTEIDYHTQKGTLFLNAHPYDFSRTEPTRVTHAQTETLQPQLPCSSRLRLLGGNVFKNVYCFFKWTLGGNT